MIRKQEPLIEADFQSLKENAMAIGFTRLKEIDNIPWEKMRAILMSMKKKYAFERDHSVFEENICLARTMWRMDSSASST